MVQEALARPIEMPNVLLATVGGSAISHDLGVYASIFTLVAQINAIAAGVANLDSCYIDSNYKVVFDCNGSQALVLNANDYWKLGFESTSYGAAPTHTAENISPFLWMPTFHGNNIDLWEPINNNFFAGSVASDGSRAGFELGPDRYSRTLQYNNEPPLNISEDFALDAHDVRAGLLNFLRESIVVQTTATTSNNISCKGFYYIPDISADPFDTGNQPVNSMDSGGVQYSLSSSPDTYTFCTYPPSDLPRLTNALGRARVRYNVDIPIESAVAPTWLVDGTT